MNRYPTYGPEAMADATIRRMQRILDTDEWPSGLALNDEDRRILTWNLDVARRQRDERRARARTRA